MAIAHLSELNYRVKGVVFFFSFLYAHSVKLALSCQPILSDYLGILFGRLQV